MHTELIGFLLQCFAVAAVIDIGKDNAAHSSHMFNFSNQDYGYVASHKAYGTKSYKPNRNWTLTLTDLNTTYLEVDFISYKLISKRTQLGACSDYLLIATRVNKTKVCKSSPGLIYFYLSLNKPNVSFTFKTNGDKESTGFWITLKSKLRVLIYE